ALVGLVHGSNMLERSSIVKRHWTLKKRPLSCYERVTWRTNALRLLWRLFHSGVSRSTSWRERAHLLYRPASLTPQQPDSCAWPDAERVALWPAGQRGRQPH